MIEIEVRYAGLPRSAAGRQSEWWLLEEGATLGKLLEMVAGKYGWRLEDNSRYMVIFNHRGIAREDWHVTSLREGDRVLIISPISGG